MLENADNIRTSLSNFGDLGLKNYIENNFPINNAQTVSDRKSTISIMDFQDNQVIMTQQLLVEGVHFDLSYFPLKHLGYKAVVMALTDIYAANATPTQIMVQMAVSNRFSLEAIEEIYVGIQLAVEKYKVDLIQTNHTSSTKGLTIAINGIGYAASQDIIKISGASEGQVLVISGDLGASYMGMQVLEREKQVFLVNPNNQPDLENYTYIIERQLKPEARMDIPPLLKALEVKPTAMVSVTRGLATEVMALCIASNVGCNVYESKLPIDPTFIAVCEEFNVDSTTIAINGGEDFELLFTIPLSDFDKIKGNPNFTVIGHLTSPDMGIHLMTREHTLIPLQTRAFGQANEE